MRGGAEWRRTGSRPWRPRGRSPRARDVDGGGQARHEIITVIKQDTSGEGQTATGRGCVRGGRRGEGGIHYIGREQCIG